MKKIIDNIANWLVTLNKRKDRINYDSTAFMKRGKNSLIVGFTFLGILFAYFAFDLHKTYGKLWLTLIPIGFFIIFIFVVLVSNSYRDKLKQHSRSSRLKLVGFNMDFNELIFKRIYGSLTRYEYLVKISEKLEFTMENYDETDYEVFDEDDPAAVVEPNPEDMVDGDDD